MSTPQFFVDNKKGEVNELRELLQKFPLEKDSDKQYETVKKVIGCMTLGIDVSGLFTDMVKISRTPDIIIKKMVYLYLVNYSENSQQCGILVMNTFLTDCKDHSYKIRALAIRTLSSIQYSAALPYIQQAVNSGLQDEHSHVRKTAVMGCLKLYRQAPDIVREGDYVETLYKLIKDPDSQVAINALIVLDEILESEGGVAVTQKLIVYLINRLKDFQEWGQAWIIGLLGRYTPKDETELVDVFNLLEGMLTYSNPSVLLAVIKVFLHYIKSQPTINKQVIERMQAPLITLMTSTEASNYYELAYVVLQHTHLLASMYADCPGYSLFQHDFRHFFCKMEEPSCIKDIKIEILGCIATENNIQEMLNELSEYVIDVNANLAKKAIACICQIAIRIPTMIELTMEMLLRFFKHRIEYISSECITACNILLRKYPEFIDVIIPEIEDSYVLINKVEAKASLIWILGEFGEKIPNAPYVLEYYASISPNEPGLSKIFYSLLTATSKLFFKRPKECKSVLEKVLKQLISNCEYCDLKKRALMYYSLFKSDIALAKKIILGNEEKQKVHAFWEDTNKEEKEEIEKEFNTLSVIYRKPQIKFLKKEYIYVQHSYDTRNAEDKELNVGKTKATTSINKDLLVCCGVI